MLYEFKQSTGTGICKQCHGGAILPRFSGRNNPPLQRQRPRSAWRLELPASQLILCSGGRHCKTFFNDSVFDPSICFSLLLDHSYRGSDCAVGSTRRHGVCLYHAGTVVGSLICCVSMTAIASDTALPWQTVQGTWTWTSI